MSIDLEEKIDLELFGILLNGLSDNNVLSVTIVDRKNTAFEITSRPAYCTEFHLKNVLTAGVCNQSCRFYPESPDNKNVSRTFRCPFGLTVGVIPVFSDGEQLGSLLYGRVFSEKPQLEKYRMHASQNGYSESEFISSAEEVPVCIPEKFEEGKSLAVRILNVLLSQKSKKKQAKPGPKVPSEWDERFRFTFEKSPDAILLTDADTGVVVDVNLAAAKLLCRPADEIIGIRQTMLYPQRNQEYTRNYFQTVVSRQGTTPESSGIENSIVRADGIEIPVEVLTSIFNLDGRRIMQQIFRDISAKKELQRYQILQHEISLILGKADSLDSALKQVLEALACYGDIDAGGIYLVKRDTISLVAHNGLSESFLGYNSFYSAASPVANILRNGLPVFYSHQDMKRLEEIWGLQEKFRSAAVFPILHDNLPLASLNLASRKFDEIPNNSRMVLYSIASNLGGAIVRLEAKQRIKESEEKYRMVFQTSPDAVSITTMDGFYADVNHGFLNMTGYAREEVIGHSLLELGIWDNPENREKMIRMLQAQGQVENLEASFRAKDGHLITSLISATLISINQTQHILSITRDISERKKMETALLASKRKAEESDLLKTSFLANISHELRTPMNGILGFAELLDDEGLTPTERREYINVINDSGRSLLAVITNLVDISKLDSGQVDKRIRLFNLNRLMDDIYKSFVHESIVHDKTHLYIDVRKGLENKSCMICSDPSKIAHIFQLLLNNAVKFTEKGSIVFGYEISSVSLIRFFVKDSGKGISKCKQNDIFDRFRQEDEMFSRKYGGIGIGLTIAKSLVEILGGHIWVESQPGVGSEFSFEIPVEYANG